MHCADLIGVSAAVLGAVVSVPAIGQCLSEEVFALSASDAGQWNLYGRSVALSGDIAVVGSLYQGFNGPPFLWGPGAAYVYRFDGEQWTDEEILTNSVPEEQDYFGGAVAISGDRIIVGAKYADGNVSSSGAADVFRFNGTGWIVEGHLIASDGQPNDEFGTSVAIDGDVALVGAPQNNLSGPGWAYVFRFNGAQWVQEIKLAAQGGLARDDFGESVAIQGNLAVISAPNRGNTAGPFQNGMGTAYVFRFNGNAWIQEAMLISADPLPGQFDRFGRSVAMDDDVIAVGTDPTRTTLPPPGVPLPVGDVYMFRHNGASWIHEAHLQHSDAVFGDRFGFDVALESGTLLAGAWGQWTTRDTCSQNPPDPDLCNSGAAYLFRFERGRWIEQAKFTAADISESDTFGWSVALSGDKALVGAWYVDEPVTNCGAAYLFGGIGDCNANGALDLCDIAGGASLDANANSVPDECEQVPGDINGDGVVNIADLLAVISAWGPCPPPPGSCPADIDGDGVVNIADLLATIANWG